MNRLAAYLFDRYFIKQPRLRHAVTRALYGTGDRKLDLFGSEITVNSLRENGYLRAAGKMGSSSLLRDEVGVLLSLALLLEPGDTFVDVGANVGLFSTTLSRIRRLPTAAPLRMYAYEPHPDTFARLLANTASAGVIARNVAASDQAGTLEFVDGAVSHVFTAASQSCAYNIDSQRRTVPTVRLDAEAVEGDSIVIKIDVEKQELAVLRGASGWLEAQRVKAVYFDGADQEAEIMRVLGGYGFRFYNGRTLAPYSPGEFSLLALRA